MSSKQGTKSTVNTEMLTISFRKITKWKVAVIENKINNNNNKKNKKQDWQHICRPLTYCTWLATSEMQVCGIYEIQDAVCTVLQNSTQRCYQFCGFPPSPISSVLSWQLGGALKPLETSSSPASCQFTSWSHVFPGDFARHLLPFSVCPGRKEGGWRLFFL